ncbi:hypothetical protein FOL47_002537 [Perkinsus chesapeaki]|uniref:CCHC-type domain-containing protein n=1 Tax=Perkinsus chesapeaki TaxID=330153 RepID=A0A7J6MD06_PERCH|nr:hypothetical protein FOL47_002537 [Perkinsus chesapeaki]
MSEEIISTDAGYQIVSVSGTEAGGMIMLSGKRKKRETRWGPRKHIKLGKRLSTVEDKPYKPMPILDLPSGLGWKQVDQIMREMRLEDLDLKLRTDPMKLELGDPDIRPPSPPPTYDQTGTRTNDRATRVRKAMEGEHNRLVRYMMATVKDYMPPETWNKARLVRKIIIPQKKYPDVPFMAIIVGARGTNHKRLQTESGCRIEIRGKGINAMNQTIEEQNMPQHVHIEGDTEANLAKATALLEPLLDPTHPDFARARALGLEQLAVVNGYTTQLQHIRCGLCQAMGHHASQCPEFNNVELSYKMADVKCDICGDKGHATIDCPKKGTAQDKTKEWRAEAEERAKVNQEYADLINNLAEENDPLKAGQVGPGASNGGADDEEIKIPYRSVGAFIGPQGSNIRLLEGETGCQIRVDQTDKDAPLCPVMIQGSAPGIADAKAKIREWLKNHDAASGANAQIPMVLGVAGDEEPIRLPAALVGVFIGHNGSNLKALEREFGVGLMIDGKKESGILDHPILFNGSDEAILEAKPKLREWITQQMAATPQMDPHLAQFPGFPGFPGGYPPAPGAIPYMPTPIMSGMLPAATMPGQMAGMPPMPQGYPMPTSMQNIGQPVDLGSGPLCGECYMCVYIWYSVPNGSPDGPGIMATNVPAATTGTDEVQIVEDFELAIHLDDSYDDVAPWSILLTSGPVLTLGVTLATVVLLCVFHKLTINERMPYKKGEPSHEKHEDSPSRRYSAVDYWRGMCISFVVIYHMVGNFRLNGLMPSGFRGVAMIHLCVGLSQALANKNRVIKWKAVIHRTMKLALLAASLSAYTYYRFPESPIVFGALHCICLNSLLSLPFVKHPNLALPGFLFCQLYTMFIGVFPLEVDLDRPSIDVMPWFNNLAFCLLGVWLHDKGLHKTPSLRLFPFRQYVPFEDSAFCTLGRWSLTVYLCHELVFVPLTLVVKQLRANHGI